MNLRTARETQPGVPEITLDILAVELPRNHPYWTASNYHREWAVALVEAFAAFRSYNQ
jgi:hypothetical protein